MPQSVDDPFAEADAFFADYDRRRSTAPTPPAPAPSTGPDPFAEADAFFAAYDAKQQAAPTPLTTLGPQPTFAGQPSPRRTTDIALPAESPDQPLRLGFEEQVTVRPTPSVTIGPTPQRPSIPMHQMPELARAVTPQFTEEITVTGKMPSTLESVARMPQRAAQGFIGGVEGPLGEAVTAASSIAYPNYAQQFQETREAGLGGLEQAGILAPTRETDLTDPQWWAAGLGNALGSATGMALAGQAGGGALGAAAIATTTESLAEAAGVYNRVLRDGATPEEALEKATGAFAGNMAVLGLSNLPIFSVGGNLLKRVLVKSQLEGAQEVVQGRIGNIATGRPAGEGDLESYLIGSMAGGAFAGAEGRGGPRAAAAPGGLAAPARRLTAPELEAVFAEADALGAPAPTPPPPAPPPAAPPVPPPAPPVEPPLPPAAEPAAPVPPPIEPVAPPGPPPEPPAPAPSAGVPFLITRAMQAELRSRGYDQAVIDAMTPEKAWTILNEPEVEPVRQGSMPPPSAGSIVAGQTRKPLQDVPAPPPVVEPEPPIAQPEPPQAPEGVEPEPIYTPPSVEPAPVTTPAALEPPAAPVLPPPPVAAAPPKGSPPQIEPAGGPGYVLPTFVGGKKPAPPVAPAEAPPVVPEPLAPPPVAAAKPSPPVGPAVPPVAPELEPAQTEITPHVPPDEIRDTGALEGALPPDGGRPGEGGPPRGDGEQHPPAGVGPADQPDLVGDAPGAGGRDSGGTVERPGGVAEPAGGGERAGDFPLTGQEQLGTGGAAGRFDANLAAIRTIKQLAAEGRAASAAEQATLARYVGWGDSSIASILNDDASTRTQALRAAVTPEEFAHLRRSALNAHYTSVPVINAIWKGVQRLGVTKGKALEPAVGIGNFIGVAPKGYKWSAVELDPLTAAIAQHLYPSATVHQTGFQTAPVARNSQDLVISNVPFSKETTVIDRKGVYTGPQGLPLHDYFFAKALDVVKPGGLVVFVTSRYTMDKLTTDTRSYLARKADLVGAYRLPSTAFEKNAGTRVVTDILILRKRLEGEAKGGEAWEGTTTVRVRGADPISDPDAEMAINEYFVAHRDHVLGNIKMGRGLYGVEPVVTPAKDWEARLATLMEELPEGLASPGVAPEEAPDAGLEDTSDMLGGTYTERDKVLYQKDPITGRLMKADLNAKEEARVRGQMRLRDELVNTLGVMRRADATKAQIAKAQAALTKAYDGYVAKHGLLNSPVNMRAFEDDPDAATVLSLENYDPETEQATKAGIFTERTVMPPEIPASAKDAQQALVFSLASKGEVDFAYMADLTGQDRDALIADLSQAGRIYKDPDTDQWVTADAYLSGNVRAKLTAAKDAKLDANVTALEKVQPADLAPVDIGARLGASWIPGSDVENFLESIGIPRAKVLYLSAMAQWDVTASWGVSETARADFGTSRVHPTEIVQATLNNKRITVYDNIGDGKRVLNPTETAGARAKQEAVQEKFAEWLWQDADRSTRLVRHYNDNFNNLRLREFDGAHLTFPGMSEWFASRMRDYQSNAVWRFLSSGNALFAHVVGSGKTWTMIASVMEAKRLGLARKAVIVAKNPTVGQFAATFKQMYPDAKVLVTSKEDFTPKSRKRLFARIATGNWDAIILPQTSFGKMPMSAAAYQAFKAEEMQKFTDMKAELSAQKAGKDTLKQVEKAMARMEAKLDKLIDKATSAKDTGGLAWEELGLDLLVVDEAHDFKNLWFQTRQTQVKGIPNPDAARAIDMYLKVRHLHQMTGDRNLILATGTPITNTMAEVYTMLRYVARPLLEERGIGHFDAWASNFGVITSGMERTAGGYKVVDRFAKFINLPELQMLFRMVADVKLASDLKLETPPLKGGKATAIQVKATGASRALMAWIEHRAKNMGRGAGKESPLKVYNDGRMGAIDLRLVNLPTVEDQADVPETILAVVESGEDKGAKLARVADEVTLRYREHAKDKGAQLIFLDQGIPGGARYELYADLKAKMVANGIPAGEIAFVHDADTDTKRLKLFQSVREGRIRVLIGSTEKLGVGVNVQDRLVAVHHVDVPYRPADLEQREGRILRQGNLLFKANPGSFEVEILNYVWEGTFDEINWQRIKTKRNFVNDFMQGNLAIRESEDVDEGVLTAGEMQAIASGDPRIMTLAKLEAEEGRLGNQAASHERSIFAATGGRLQSAKATERWASASIPVLEEGIPQIKVPKEPEITLKGKRITGTEAIGQALLEAKPTDNTEGYVKVGTYGSFTIHVRMYGKHTAGGQRGGPTAEVLGVVDWAIHLPNDPDGEVAMPITVETPMGVARSLAANTTTEHWQALLRRRETLLAQSKKDQAEIAALAGKPFPKAARLKAVREELKALREALGATEADKAAVADTAEGEEDEGGAGGGTSALPTGTGQLKMPAPPVAPAGAPTGRKPSPPVSLKPSAMLEDLRRALDLPVNVGRYRERVRGLFRDKPREIRLRVAHDLLAAFHEHGHDFDYTLLKIDRKDPRWADELRDLGQATSKPRYTRTEQRKEGAAEFFRLYLMEPGEALRLAPEYHQAFEAALDGEPALKKIVTDTRARVQEYLKLSHAERGRLKIHREKPRRRLARWAQRAKQDPRGVVTSFLAAHVDDYAWLNRAVREMKDGRPLPADEHAGNLATLARGSGEQALSFLRDGVYGENMSKLSDSLESVLKPVRDELVLFGDYLVGLRAKELAGRGIETGLHDEEITEMIENVRSRTDRARFDRAAQGVYDFQEAVLDYAIQFKGLDLKTAHTMRQVNKYYVPFQRVMEDIDDLGRKVSITGKRLGDRRAPIYRIKGSGRDIIDPLESIIKNTMAMVDYVERNRAMTALVDLAENSAGSAKWLSTEIPPKNHPVHVNVLEALEKVDPDLAEVVLGLGLDPAAMATLWRPQVKAAPGERIHTVFRKGKLELVQFNHKGLEASVMAMSPRLLGELAEVLSVPAKVLRAGATLTPQFMFRNLARDTVGAYIQSGYGFLPVYDTVRGALEWAGGGKYYHAFKASGGMQSAMGLADRDYTQDILADMTDPRAVRKFLRTYVLNGIEGLRALSGAIEIATRIGEAKLAIEAGGEERGVLKRLVQGKSQAARDFEQTGELPEAVRVSQAIAGRRVTIDFQRAGWFGREVNRYSAFYNARIGGIARMVEKATEDPTGTLLRASSLAVISAILWALNEDDEEYQNRPRWERDLFWHVPLGAGRYIKFPKPHEFGLLFGTTTERALDYVNGKDPRALDKLRATARMAGWDVIGGAIGTSFLPIVETYFNYDTFRERWIVPPWDLESGTPNKLLYTDYTSAVAKDLGSLLDYPPAKIDHLIYGYTAGLGRLAMATVDPLFRIGDMEKASPARRGGALFGEAFVTTSAYSSQSEDLVEFTAMLKALKAAETAESDFYERGMTADVDRVVAEGKASDWFPHVERLVAAENAMKGKAQDLIAVTVSLETGEQQVGGKSYLGDLRKALNEVYDDPQQSMEDKTEARDRIYEEMLNIARQGLGKEPLKRRRTLAPVPVAARAQ